MTQDPLITKMIENAKREQEARGRTVLMAYRCGYITPIAGIPRVPKILPAWVWRLVHKVECRFSRRKKDLMFELLESLYNRENERPRQKN
jgi:hypothetical protein